MRLDNPRDDMIGQYEKWVESHNLEFTDETFDLFNDLLEVEKLEAGIRERIQALKDQAADIRRQREFQILAETIGDRG